MESKNFFQSDLSRRILSLLLLLGIIISIKPMMNLLLLTFMFSFILYGVQNYIFHKIIRLIPINRTEITFTIFIILASAIIFFIYKYAPILTKQLMFIGIQLSNFDINSYEDVIKILYILGMIVVLHALEAYFLNPKLMSIKTKLPMFFTFIVLIMAEHFMGVWGLLFGIPLFLFFLDMIDVESQ